MPIMPGGKLIGLSRNRTVARLAKEPGRIGPGADLLELGGMIDVVHYRTEDPDSWYFSGGTLADILEETPFWPKAHRNSFDAWLMDEEQMKWIREVGNWGQQVPDTAQFQPVNLLDAFYSPLRRSVEAMPLYKAPAVHWLNGIKKLVRKGVSAQEIHWSGILAWLSYARGSLRKQDLLEFLETHPLKLQVGSEVAVLPYHRLDFQPCTERLQGRQARRLGYAVVRFLNRAWNYRITMVRSPGPLGSRVEWVALDAHWKRVADTEGNKVFATPQAAQDAASRDATRRYPLRQDTAPLQRHMTEAFANGDDYREWLITLPDYPVPYLSRHFRTLNIIAHLRTKIRQEHLGERRFLFVEELQSDWFQGRQRHRDRGGQSCVPGYVPDVPFRGEWVELALKFMVFHAAREGLDGIAWIRSDHQEERYGGRWMAMHTLYDQRIPRFFQRLERSTTGQLDTVVFRTRRPWLYCETHKGKWRVLSLDKRFQTGYRFTRHEAARIQVRHSPVTTVAVPVFWMNDATRHAILEKGFPMFGLASL